MSRMRLLCGLAVAALLAAPAGADTPEPAIFYASQSGGETLDEGAGGGNPFAGAFVAAFTEPDLRFGALPRLIRDHATRASDGFQLADVPADPHPAGLRLTGAHINGSRVALVAVVSAYRGVGVPSLPGAARDAGRVAAALRRAGYDVTLLLDRAPASFDAGLAAFAARSAHADVAVIYATGHGYEHRGSVYLLMPDYAPGAGTSGLIRHGATVATLAAAGRARTANLMFWAGCRTLFQP